MKITARGFGIAGGLLIAGTAMLPYCLYPKVMGSWTGPDGLHVAEIVVEPAEPYPWALVSVFRGKDIAVHARIRRLSDGAEVARMPIHPKADSEADLAMAQLVWVSDVKAVLRGGFGWRVEVRLPDPPRNPTPPAATPAQSEPSRSSPVVVIGRLVEEGGFVPTPGVLQAIKIVPRAEGVKDVWPHDDGGFSFHWPDPRKPVSFDVRVAYHAVVGDRTLIDEVASVRVDLGAEPGPSIEAGTVRLPEAARLASLSGAALSAGGKPLVLSDLWLEGENLPGGGRIRLAGRGVGLGHVPNAPAGYLAADRFAFLHVPAGRYEIALWAPGHLRLRNVVDLVAGRADTRIFQLHPSVQTLKGVVFDAVTGAPIVRAEVRLVLGSDPVAIGSAQTGADGLFAVGLEEEPGVRELRLKVEADGYETAISTIRSSLPFETVRLSPAGK